MQIRVFFLRSWFISFKCMFGEEYNIFYLIWWRNSLLSKKTYWSSFILCAYVSMLALSLTLFYSKCYSDRPHFCGWIDFFILNSNCVYLQIWVKLIKMLSSSSKGFTCNFVYVNENFSIVLYVYELYVELLTNKCWFKLVILFLISFKVCNCYQVDIDTICI